MAKRWELTFVRVNGRRLADVALKNQLGKITGVFDRNQTLGMKATAICDPPEETPRGLKYLTTIKVTKKKVRSEEAAERNFAKAKERAKKAAQRFGWTEASADGEPFTPAAPKVISIRQNLDFQLPPLTDEVFTKYFGRIYEREPHIRTIYKAAQTAVRTRFDKRRHVLAYGLPAGAKSEVFSAFKKWFNEDGEHVLPLDATTTTKAGLELLLLERAEMGDLPPFLYLEEIEKHDINSLLSLLQVMDHRGRISRTNARQGNVSGDAKIVVWATCNDYQKLRKFEGGALFSRFNLRLWSPRPSRELMQRILEREADEMGATRKCIGKILEFGFNELKTNDPREFIALLDGWENIKEYLEDQRKILEGKRRDLQELEKYLAENNEEKEE